MLIIHMPQGVSPFQVENFPKKCKRSAAGAIHLKPGATKILTENEWEWISKEYPAECVRAVVNKEIVKPPKKIVEGDKGEGDKGEGDKKPTPKDAKKDNKNKRK